MRTLLSACAALALICSAADTGEKPLPLSDEDFAAAIRTYLVSDRYEAEARSRMMIEGARRGQDAYRQTVEAEVRKAMDNQNVRQRYLSEADELGPSDLYWKIALAEIKDAKTVYIAGSYLDNLSRYLDKNPDAHKEQLGDLSAALWAKAEDGTDGVCPSIFNYLARGEPAKVRTFIEQKLAGKLPDRDRAYYLEIYARITEISDKDRLALFTKELNATESTYVASSLQRCLEPLLGADEAYKLVRPKLQLKGFRGQSQVELRQARVSFEFIDVPLRDALNYLRNNVGLDLTYDAEAQKIVDSPASVEMHVTETPATTALARMLAPAGLMWKQQGAKLLITKGTMKDTTTAVELAAIGKIMQKKASLEFNDSRLDGGLSLWGSMTGLDIWIDEGSRKDVEAVKLSGKFEGRTGGELLQKMLTPHGLKYRILHGGIQIYKDAPAK